MINLQHEYNLIKEGKGNIPYFKKIALNQCPNLVSPLNSFDDMVSILKTKNIISENIITESIHDDKSKYEKIISDGDRVNPYELEKGIKYEMKSPIETWKMDGAGKFDISVEDYFQAMKTAVDNLKKDPMFYTRMITKEKNIQPEKRSDTMKLVKDKKFVDDLNKMNPIKK